MSDTSIEWVKNSDGSQGKTWNPVRGCTRVSPGCKNCYAERIAARFSGTGPLRSPGCNGPKDAFAGFAKSTPSGPRWTGKVELIESMLDIPLRRKKPTTWFVNSMSDLFHESLPDEAIDRVFAVMALCPQHTFQVLTKRAKRMREYFSALIERRRAIEDQVDCLATYLPDLDLPIEEVYLPPGNVRLGVSCEDQQRADERIPELMKLAAMGWKTMVSAEPLLGPVDLSRFLRAVPQICQNCGGQLALDDKKWQHRIENRDGVSCSTEFPSSGGLPAMQQGVRVK